MGISARRSSDYTLRTPGLSIQIHIIYIYLVWPQRGTWLHRTAARSAGSRGTAWSPSTFLSDCLQIHRHLRESDPKGSLSNVGAIQIQRGRAVIFDHWPSSVLPSYLHGHLMHCPMRQLGYKWSIAPMDHSSRKRCNTGWTELAHMWFHYPGSP
jgi:hypothetical protein